MGEQLSFVFNLPEFEGPLDLLIYLVRKHRVDIRSIPITTIADEFISHIEKMKSLDMEIASDFMVMASTLMEMKSKAILPRLNPLEEEELKNQEKELFARVEEYQTLKELSKRMRTKLYESYSYERARVEITMEDSNGDPLPDRLVTVFKSILDETVERNRVYTITSEEVSIEDKMNEIEELYETINLIAFLRELGGRMEIVTAFLAILELIKLGRYEIATLEPDPIIKRVNR